MVIKIKTKNKDIRIFYLTKAMRRGYENLKIHNRHHISIPFLRLGINIIYDSHNLKTTEDKE